MANFAAGMGAFIIIGILNPLSESFGMSSAQAGWVLTTFAIAYAIGSPLLVALTGRWERRTVLLTGLSVFTLATLWSALSPDMTMLFASRVAVAIGAALITPVTAGVAIAVSRPEQTGKALAAVFFGLTLAQAIGLPIGSFVAYTYGYGAAFGVVVALGLLSLVGIAWAVPRGLPFKPNSLSTLTSSLADWRRMSVILFIGSFLGAIYVLYTYFSPLMAQSMGYGRDGISLLLFVFGLGAVFGNMLGGWMADRFGAMKTLIIIGVLQVILLPLYSALPMSGGWLLVLTFFWSVFGWSVAAPQQLRVVKVSSGSENVALALHASSIYIGISMGSLIGGVIVAKSGLMALGVGAGVCAIFALVHLFCSERWVNAGAPIKKIG
ncbi:MAG: MFS transporter [Burkholderiaceae bacterium]